MLRARRESEALAAAGNAAKAAREGSA
jgi:hypothetical protein